MPWPQTPLRPPRMLLVVTRPPQAGQETSSPHCSFHLPVPFELTDLSWTATQVAWVKCVDSLSCRVHSSQASELDTTSLHKTQTSKNVAR